MTPPLPHAGRAAVWGGGCAVCIGLGGWALGATGHGMVLGYALPVALIWACLGLVWNVLRWVRTPLPYPIALTCGQYATLNAPTSLPGVGARLLAETFGLRTLWRNTRATDAPPHPDGMPRMAWILSPWLGIWALLLHLGLFWTAAHHLRLWTTPPDILLELIRLDMWLDLGTPAVRLSALCLVVGVAALLARRLFAPGMRALSLPVDVLLLVLLGGLAITGMLLRHGTGVDLVLIREFLTAPFDERLIPNLPPVFFAHLGLACALLICLPGSKLMHGVVVWLSPLRCLPCDTRRRSWHGQSVLVVQAGQAGSGRTPPRVQP